MSQYLRLSADSRKPSSVVFIWVTFTNSLFGFGGWKFLFFSPLSPFLYMLAEGSFAKICSVERAWP